jgi:plasmid maintenance system antidote protein VapI
MAKPTQEITKEELANILGEMVTKWGSQKAVAEHLGISNSYLSDILSGMRPASDTVARKLGYKRIVKYAPDGSIE